MKFIFRSKTTIIIVILLFITAAVPVFTYASDVVEKIGQRLPENVYLQEIYIGGKTLAEVESIIDNKVEQKENKEVKIVFTINGQAQNRNFTLEELGYYSDDNLIKLQISNIINDDSGFIEKLRNYKAIEKSGKVFRISQGIEFDKFASALKIFDVENLDKPVNAMYKYQDGQVVIVNSKSGYGMDIEGLYNEVLESLDENKDSFELEKKEVKADITTENLEKQGIKEKVVSFTTKFTASNKPRSRNVSLAGKLIDGTILAPGETFSFNEVVGQRTKQRGFEEAGVYVNGKVDQGIGGGICQVSTTLYNAVLLADLEIVERRNHSLTVPYVPLSRDAAVSWGTQDFRFKNNTEYYIYIHTKLTKDTITFELFSTKGNKTVELVSTTLEKKEASIQYIEESKMETGKQVVVDKGHDGYKSKLIKKVYVDGKLVEEKTMTNDRYLSSPKIIKKGTKEVDKI
jgi:vancomycin resistance protein YoaR